MENKTPDESALAVAFLERQLEEAERSLPEALREVRAAHDTMTRVLEKVEALRATLMFVGGGERRPTRTNALLERLRRRLQELDGELDDIFRVVGGRYRPSDLVARGPDVIL